MIMIDRLNCFARMLAYILFCWGVLR